MQLYHDYDLMIYFYIYAFLGWIAETIISYIWKGKYTNRGILNQPLLPVYGFDMLFLIIGSGVSQAHLVLQFLMNIFRVAIIRNVAAFLCQRLLKITIPGSEKGKRDKKAELYGLAVDVSVATVTFAVFKICHPFVYLAVSLCPALLIKVVCILLLLLVGADLLLILYSVRKIGPRPVDPADGMPEEDITNWQKRMSREKSSLGYRLADQIHSRLERIYPELCHSGYEGIQKTDSMAEKEGRIFARGVCIDKLIWVFLISSLLGDGIETIYVRIVGGTWMRRSGVVFGPFSIVWGIGAVLLTIVLYRFAEKNKFQVFLGGFLLGGTYEYMASVILETLFHVRFWDYSKMPLNIGGRTNLPYMLGWGFLAMVWICLCYPVMSRVIERIPPISGKILSWLLMITMLLDLLVTGAVMLRYNTRKEYPQAGNLLERYLDSYYTDEDVQEMWPNLTQNKAG